jgi:glycosyltransferase involved in cell wall biosynthesis
MRIVQTPVRFYPAIGGVEKYVYDLSLELVNLGNQVTVICANEPQSDCTEVRGIRVRRLPYLFKVADTNITPLLFFRLMEEDFDLIHTHFPTPWSAELSLLCAKARRKPCILTYHNDVEKKGILGFLTNVYNRTLLRFLLANVDKVLITQPRYVEDSRFLSTYRNKVAVITNGISELPREVHRVRDKATLLFVGILDRHHRYKGLGYLLEAVGVLEKHWPDIRLEVVGKGELILEYRELVQHLGIEDHVCFHGYINDQELSEFYQTCTIFILPSVDLHEGFGIVLLEAMAHGMPVITTTVVGLSDEIKDCDAGIIVSIEDPSAIARAVNILLSDPQQMERMGTNGRGLIQKKYLWKVISKELLKIYEGFEK